uniref:Myotubularin-related protein 10 n=2 Tax=Taeniopygia guttata TaxID=59729 RepID=A0A674GRJ6_TAEGU
MGRGALHWNRLLKPLKNLAVNAARPTRAACASLTAPSPPRRSWDLPLPHETVLGSNSCRPPHGAFSSTGLRGRAVLRCSVSGCSRGRTGRRGGDRPRSAAVPPPPAACSLRAAVRGRARPSRPGRGRRPPEEPLGRPWEAQGAAGAPCGAAAPPARACPGRWLLPWGRRVRRGRPRGVTGSAARAAAGAGPEPAGVGTTSGARPGPPAATMFSLKQPKPTFKSYLLPQADENISSEPRIKKLEPVLLPGEIVVNEVNFVRKCIATDTSQYDLWGKLVCTNFKISFITDDPMPLQKFHYKNLLLGEHDVPLTCIEQIVTVNDTKRKQKVLGPNQKLKFNPTELIIYCKDFRIVRFRFDEAGPESAKKVCLAIAHYSQPTDLQLLFAFEYVGEIYHNPAKKVNGIDPGGGGSGISSASGQQTPLFETYSDWDREIKRTGASEWRVCSVNEGYMISTCLPEYFVVPSSLADQDLKLYSYSFIGRRMPLWSWNHPNGSALVRMANIKDVLQQRRIDQRICNAITRSHPLRSDVYKSDLDKCLPNIQEIQAAHNKLKQLCVDDPFDETEEKWLSSLENTRWLEYIRVFLKHSAELVYMMECKHVSVVLQEEEGRDLSCLAASLVQVMLDPYFRTIVGFQSLIQKEWVMAGYQFLDRCNHLKRSDKESPLFLMFLDCVWQLLEQYPAAFEFSEVYLTILYDSARISLFGTFLFNCPHQRVKESTEFAISKNIQLGDEKGLRFPCVWDWSLQFTSRDRLLFHNPLYIGKSAPSVHNGALRSFKRSKKNYSSTLRGVPPALKNGIIGEQEFLPRRNSLILKLKPEFFHSAEGQSHSMEQYFRDWFAKPVDLHGVILPHLSGTQIKLWKLCYFRWVPEAQINHGGSITAFHRASLLADEVDMLNRSLRQCKSNSSLQGRCSELDQSRMYFRANGLNDTSGAPDFLSSSFPFSPVGNLCRRSILGTPLSKFLSGAKIWLSTETLANED